MRRTTRHYKGSARGGAPRGRRPSGCPLARGLCQDGEKYVIIRVLYGTCFTQTREVLRCSARCNVGLVAQLVEQRIENPRVGGSIPPQATRFHAQLLQLGIFISAVRHTTRDPALFCACQAGAKWRAGLVWLEFLFPLVSQTQRQLLRGGLQAGSWQVAVQCVAAIGRASRSKASRSACVGRPAIPAAGLPPFGPACSD